MLLLNKSAVAVAEAIKRYSLNVNNITLTNNGLKAKECTLMIDSFTKHFQMIQTLTISKNKMGLDGAKFLAQSLPEMKILSKLIISDNEVGDHGVNDIIVACKAPGYEDKTIRLVSSASTAGVAGGAFIDLGITDMITGAMWQYQNEIRVALNKPGQAPANTDFAKPL